MVTSFAAVRKPSQSIGRGYPQTDIQVWEQVGNRWGTGGEQVGNRWVLFQEKKRCGRPFMPRLASEVRTGDNLRTQHSFQKVVSVEDDVMDMEVLELRLHDTRGSFFVGMPGSLCLTLGSEG